MVFREVLASNQIAVRFGALVTPFETPVLSRRDRCHVWCNSSAHLHNTDVMGKALFFGPVVTCVYDLKAVGRGLTCIAGVDSGWVQDSTLKHFGKNLNRAGFPLV